MPATKKSLFWVNDFPPVTSGIATFFVNILCRLPPDRIAVITPRMEGAARIDAGLNFPVERLSLPIGESRTDKLVKTVMTLFHAMKKSLLTRPARHHCGQVLSSGLAGWVCRLFLGTPYVVYVYGSETVRLGQGWLSGWLMRSILGRSERIIANSRYTAEEFIRFGIPERHIQVIYPGVDTERFTPELPDAERMERYGLKPGRVLLTIARLDERKGHDMVIRALSRLAGKWPDLIYLIGGKGREESRLRGLVEKLHLEDRVRFMGFIPDDDLPDIYRLCDVFVMPNRTTRGPTLAGDVEGFGISFMEAASCGKPVIAGRSGGAVEAVVDEETGLLVDPEAVEDIARAMERLLSDAELRLRMGQAARLRAETRFDWNLLAGQVEETL